MTCGGGGVAWGGSAALTGALACASPDGDTLAMSAIPSIVAAAIDTAARTLPTGSIAGLHPGTPVVMRSSSALSVSQGRFPHLLRISEHCGGVPTAVAAQVSTAPRANAHCGSAGTVISVVVNSRS